MLRGSRWSFTVTGPDNFTRTVKYSEFTDGKYMLEDLPTGEYTVVEEGADFFENYSLNVSYGVTGGKTTVIKGETAGVTVTNTYSQDVGSLEVKKTFADNALTEEQKAAVEFTVTGPNNYSASKTYAEFVNGSWKLENLPVGEYTVTESNADVAGYTRTTAYSVEGGKATVSKGGKAEVEVTNSYTRDLGKLELEKVIAGAKGDADLTDAQREQMSFTVTGPDGYSQTVKYSEFTDGKYMLEDLPTGEYTVVEEGADFFENYSLNVSYGVTGGKTTVIKGETAGVTVTNTYSQDVGSLEVKKTFADNALTEEQKAAVEFTVTGPNNYSASKTYAEFVNGSWKLENLPVGEYTVTESNADVAGYTRTTAYSVKGGKATVSKGGKAEVEVTNSYTRDLGKLELEKVIAGAKGDADLTDAQREQMSFTVTGPDGYSQTVKYSEFTDGKYMLEDTADRRIHGSRGRSRLLRELQPERKLRRNRRKDNGNQGRNRRSNCDKHLQPGCGKP